MRINRYGFSLIEFLIYLAAMALLLVILFQCCSTTLLYSYRSRKQELIQARLSAVYDRLATDIFYASAATIHEDAARNTLIWSVQGKSICWHVKNNVLYRTQGTYDFENLQWQRKRKAAVITGVAAFSLQSEKKDGRVVAVRGVMSMVQAEGVYSWRLPLFTAAAEGRGL